MTTLIIIITGFIFSIAIIIFSILLEMKLRKDIRESDKRCDEIIEEFKKKYGNNK